MTLTTPDAPEPLGDPTAAAVVWTDVAPRDGLQNIADTVSTDIKVRLINGLFAAGAPRVEATSFVSPKWVPQLADAADVLEGVREHLPRIRVLIPNRKGLDLALEHGVRNVVFTIGVTDTFNQRNVNRPVRDSLADLVDICEAAKAAACTVDVALSVAFGCPFEGEVAPERVADLVYEIAQLSVDEIGLADTIGVADPGQVAALCRPLVRRAAAWTSHIALHVHDTRGMGVANVIAAYDAGIRHFDGSAGGLGGCPFAPRSTGNVCSEDALQALMRRGAATGVDLDAYCQVAAQLGDDLSIPLPGKLHRAGVWLEATSVELVEEWCDVQRFVPTGRFDLPGERQASGGADGEVEFVAVVSASPAGRDGRTVAPGGVRVAVPLALRAVLTDEPLTVSERGHVARVDSDVSPQARERGLEGGGYAVETVREPVGMLPQLGRKAVARPNARATAECGLQSRVILVQGRGSRPGREAVESLYQTRSDESTRAVPAPACPTEGVKLHDQGCYFIGVEECANLRNSRATRYLARCHWRSLSIGRAPGSANCAGAYSFVISPRVLVEQSDGTYA